MARFIVFPYAQPKYFAPDAFAISMSFEINNFPIPLPLNDWST